MTRHERSLALAAGVAAMAALAACSTSPGSGDPATSRAGATASSSTAAPAPAATGSTTDKAQPPAVTESNPPGDIPDNQVFVAYTPPGSRVSVKVPEGWSRHTGAGTTTFTDKLNEVAIKIGPTTSRPTPQTVRTKDVPALSAAVPKFALGAVSTVRRAGQDVVLLTYQGDSAPNPVTGKVVRDAFERYTYFHSGQRVDLTLSGPTNADNVDPWKTVSGSVTWS